MLFLLAQNEAGAQTKKKEAPQKKTRTEKKFTPGRQNKPVEKSINDNTTGVMGQDTIQLNNKGMELNKNYNTGTDLPPSNGNNPPK